MFENDFLSLEQIFSQQRNREALCVLCSLLLLWLRQNAGQSSFRKEGFALVHSLKAFHPSWWEGVMAGDSVAVGCKTASSYLCIP